MFTYLLKWPVVLEKMLSQVYILYIRYVFELVPVPPGGFSTFELHYECHGYTGGNSLVYSV